MKSSIKISLIILMIILNITAGAAEYHKLKGVVVSAGNHSPVSFANIAFFDSAGVMRCGTTSSFNGEFQIELSDSLPGVLRVSSVGYSTRELVIGNTSPLTLTVELHPEQTQLEEVLVSAQRIKASTDKGKTTYFINSSMQKVATNATGLLKLIPGVHIDIHRNIFLEGSSQVLILVNGMERDRQYLSQLNHEHIDRIEVMTNPSLKYDSKKTGVINIILRNDPPKGISGNINAEIPVSQSEVYLFPDYNLNLTAGKLNIFTSYNGEISYFDIRESYQREFMSQGEKHLVNSRQDVSQKNWSHRFHYGVDYLINERNQLNLYGYINPFSQEHDGNALVIPVYNTENYWEAQKEDKDRNTGFYYSLFYRHIFNKEREHELELEASFYNMHGENKTTYSNQAAAYRQVNITRPLQEIINVRLDYNRPLLDYLSLNSGFQLRSGSLKDKTEEGFEYLQDNIAFFSSIDFTKGKLKIGAGLRHEESQQQGNLSDKKDKSYLLPGLSGSYRFSSSSAISFSWRESLKQPGYYQLNPAINIEDPYTIITGNPGLSSVRIQDATIEFTKRTANSFYSTALFTTRSRGVINALHTINEDGIMESRLYNLGDITLSGIKFSAGISLGTNAGLQPYIRAYQVRTRPGSVAQLNNISSKRQLAMDAGLSAYINPGAGFSAAVTFRYASPIPGIQSTYFEQAQYFLSIDKTITPSLKAGLVSAMPFTRNYTYRSSEINSPELYNLSKGVISMSRVPVWFKLSYRFSSGTNRERIKAGDVMIENERRKGF